MWESVAAGNVLCLVECAVQCNGIKKMAIKCVKVTDGQDTCTVAFVPRVTMNLPKAQQHLNKFVQVLELCNGSKNTHKQSKSEASCGIVAIKLPLEDGGRNE